MTLQNHMKNSKRAFYIFFTIFVISRNLAFCASIENHLTPPAEHEDEDIPKLPEVYGSSFYYFGFGSNMLTKRIHIQNPTARKIGAVKLDNFRLDFYGSRPDFYGAEARWNGAPATIVPEANAVTYGTLWSIDLSNLHDIDDQEGVFEHIYAPESVQVELLSNGTIYPARAYYLVEQPVKNLESYDREDIPYDRQPSKTYLKCLVKGAIETGLPAEYVTWLQSIKHNNCTATEMEELLELKLTKLNS